MSMNSLVHRSLSLRRFHDVNFAKNLEHGEKFIGGFYFKFHGDSNKDLRFLCINITYIYF